MSKLRLIRVVLGVGITSFVAAFLETLSAVLIFPSLSATDTFALLCILFVANVFLIIGTQRIIIRKAKKRLAAGLNKASPSRRELERELKKGWWYLLFNLLMVVGIFLGVYLINLVFRNAYEQPLLLFVLVWMATFILVSTKRMRKLIALRRLVRREDKTTQGDAPDEPPR